jgi:hypothetical protein
MRPLSDDDFDPPSPRMLVVAVIIFLLICALLDYLGLKP